MIRNLKIMSVLALIGVGIFVVVFSNEPDSATVCSGRASGLTSDAPPELVGIFNRDCAAALVNEQGVGLAYDYGYPSLVMQNASKSEAQTLIEATIAEGDRGFFVNDPIVLEQMDGTAADFVRASLFPQDSLSLASDPQTVLQSIPLWNANQNQQIIVGGCDDTDCQADITICDGYVGLSDKLAIATDEKSFEDVYATCPTTPAWVLALRRAGLVDTSCTSTLAVNRAMDRPETLGQACFPDGFDAQTLPGVGSADLLRLLRARGPSQLSNLGEGNIRAIESFFPSIAHYLTQEGER